jgi:hypothetical protein
LAAPALKLSPVPSLAAVPLLIVCFVI